MPGKRGRPPANPTARRSVDVHVRFPSRDFDRLCVAAKDANVSLAEFCRRRVFRDAASTTRRVVRTNGSASSPRATPTTRSACSRTRLLACKPLSGSRKRRLPRKPPDVHIAKTWMIRQVFTQYGHPAIEFRPTHRIHVMRLEKEFRRRLLADFVTCPNLATRGAPIGALLIRHVPVPIFVANIAIDLPVIGVAAGTLQLH